VFLKDLKVRQDPKQVRGTFLDSLSILFHKSTANFFYILAEDHVPVHITCFTTLGKIRIFDFGFFPERYQGFSAVAFYGKSVGRNKNLIDLRRIKRA